jgi:uncharacterized protein (TIGR02246 family)
MFAAHRRTLPFRSCLVLWLLFALVLAGCGEAPSPEMEAEVDAPTAEEVMADAEARIQIDSLRLEWVRHYNLHHPDMVADLYTSDAWVGNADLSIVEGRSEMGAYHRSQMEASPRVEVEMPGIRVFGDQAVGWGTYAVTLAGPQGEDMTVSGSYLTLLRRENGAWGIAARLANYDSPRPPDWEWGEPGEAPPEESTMGRLHEAYETHWNQSHPDELAGLFTQDAVAAFAGAPAVQGRSRIRDRMREVLEETPSTIDIHGVTTIELADGWVLDGGWYELFEPDSGEAFQSGIYMGLNQQGADGQWLLHWLVSNARPAGAM